MTERENSSTLAGESQVSPASTTNHAPATQRRAGSMRTLWVVLLTLPVTIAALAIAIEVFGLLLRLGGQ
ncbi:MAG: hypothetical protein RXR20_19225 [Paraburkholderia sp.]|jgi:hypothetical protein|uniref:hypothetical protein n=1 Tax=Burkholderiaceae TaxID=119060 RepID=UPI0010F98994|nr:hypothetical protein [Burkholderia sp. 4M9327F10]